MAWWWWFQPPKIKWFLSKGFKVKLTGFHRWSAPWGSPHSVQCSWQPEGEGGETPWEESSRGFWVNFALWHLHDFHGPRRALCNSIKRSKWSELDMNYKFPVAAKTSYTQTINYYCRYFDEPQWYHMIDHFQKYVFQTLLILAPQSGAHRRGAFRDFHAIPNAIQL